MPNKLNKKNDDWNLWTPKHVGVLKSKFNFVSCNCKFVNVLLSILSVSPIPNLSVFLKCPISPSNNKWVARVQKGVLLKVVLSQKKNMGVTTPVYHEIWRDIDFMSLCSFGVTQLLLDKILPQLMIGNASHLIRVGYVYIYIYIFKALCIPRGAGLFPSTLQ